MPWRSRADDPAEPRRELHPLHGRELADFDLELADPRSALHCHASPSGVASDEHDERGAPDLPLARSGCSSPSTTSACFFTQAVSAEQTMRPVEVLALQGALADRDPGHRRPCSRLASAERMSFDLLVCMRVIFTVPRSSACSGDADLAVRAALVLEVVLVAADLDERAGGEAGDESRRWRAGTSSGRGWREQPFVRLLRKGVALDRDDAEMFAAWMAPASTAARGRC
jgi:hypothetical protein